ncbi:hypothetical protein IMZ48_41415, partial [Candidatus Bathyarchaeota archaeon]|nr:hypothetical protein [Candidatus Bathyarchaeota archaeon]
MTSSQDHGYQASQQWEAADSEPPRATDCIVDLPSVSHLDRSEYLSVQLSQTSTEGATQSSQPSLPRFWSQQRRAVDSQRTIPDSQETQSYDTPNDPLPSEGLHAPPALTLAPPASTSDSWPPPVVPFSQEQVPSADNSLSRLLQKPGGEAHESKGSVIPDSAERSEPSIPSRQPDSFPGQHDSQSARLPSSHSVEHSSNSLRTSGLHLPWLTHISDSPGSGPEFLTQPQFTLHLPSTSQASSAHPTNSGNKDKDSAVPESSGKASSQGAKSTQDQLSYNSHAADYGSAQSQDSVYYDSQALPNLLNSSQQPSGPESPSARDAVPDTVLRRPQQGFDLAWAQSSPEDRSQQSESHTRIHQSPPREPAELPNQQSTGSQVIPPSMDHNEPMQSSAMAELLQLQSEVMSERLQEEPYYFGSAESAAPDEDLHPEFEASPRRDMHPPMLSSGIQPGSIGSSMAPDAASRAGEEPSAPTSELFATQEQIPSHGVALSQAEGAIPVTVAPGDIQPSEFQPLGLDVFVAPSQITTDPGLPATGSRQLPVHDSLFSERQHVPVDIPTDMTISEEEYGADDSQNQLPGHDEPKEFTLSLPFPANQRHFYDDRIMQSRPDIEDFCRIFNNEVCRTPKPSAVHKMETLFLELLDVCDHPPKLDAPSWESLSRKEVQDYLYESNAKFSLIWDMLDLLRDMQMRVLIVARSEQILSFLRTIAEVEGYAFSRDGLQNMQFSHARSPINIVLALPDQTLPDDPSDFDLVFGFDFEFKRSVVANQLARLQPQQKRPMVLSLVIAHSLEHIDLC